MAIFSIFKTLLFCAATLPVLLASPSSAQSNNHLLSGERLGTRQSLINGNVYLTMHYNCDLILYDSKKPIWASNTGGLGSGCFVSLQNNGNLVINDSNYRTIWTSNTRREEGYYILVLQKDRNLVIYGQPIWASRTNSVGSVDIVVADARNGMVGILGAE